MVNHYLKPYRLKAILAIFLKFLEAVFELMLPFYMVKLIDIAFLTGNTEQILVIILKMSGLTILGYVSSMTCQYLASDISQKMAGNIRTDLYHKIVEFKVNEFQVFSKEGLLTRMSLDVNNVQDLVARTIRLAVRAPFLMAGSLFAMYKISPKLGLILLKSFPVFVIFVSLFMYLSKKYHQYSQKLLDQFKTHFGKVIEGMRYVRAFNMQEHEAIQLSDMNHSYYKSQLNIGRVSSVSTPLIVLMMNLILAYLIYLGAIEISYGTMTQGEMLAIINYCTQLVMTLIVFTNLVLIFARGIVSSQRIEDVLNYELDFYQGDEVLGDVIESIEFINVSYQTKDKTKILENVSFKLNQGESLGIVGLSGSGKTTILNLIMRFVEPTEGMIKVNGVEISKYNYENYLDKIAFVTQTPLFFNDSLEKNIALNQDVNISEHLVRAQGAEILEKGMDYELYDQAANLSGGQKQRVSVARAFAKPSSIFILDEALNGLDRKTMRAIQDEILHLPQQLIVVSQNISFLSKFDKVLVLADKKVQGFGTFSEVKDTEVIQKISEMAVQL